MTEGDSQRRIERFYRDPVDEIWLSAARALGLKIVRSDEVYASYDGRGTLALSAPAHMDPDDSLAQLIFHELCHALVAGEHAFEREDWALCNLDGRDLTAEHACHRLQAALSGAYGLRGLFAVTTDHRPYWDSLGEDPLAEDVGGGDPAVEIARQAFERARRPPFGPVLEEALRRTARVAEAVGEVAEEGSLWEARTRTSTTTSTSTRTRTTTITTARASAVAVREARGEDYARVRELFAGLDVLHREALPWLFQRSDQELRPDELLGRLTGDAGVLLVAEGEGAVLGFALLLLQQPPAQRIFVPGTHILLDNLVVDPTARRRGVGTALLHHAEAWARAHGATRIELNVYDFNEPALTFYEAAGYTALGHRLQRQL